MCRRIRLKLAVFSTVIGLAAPIRAETPGSLSWLSGHWRMQNDRSVSEEIWTSPEGGLMLGVNRTIRDGKARAFEFLRIVIGPKTALFAQPGGAPATLFGLQRSGPDFVVFENPDHDYPQRVAYRRTGDRLTATISDLEGKNVRKFVWNRNQ